MGLFNLFKPKQEAKGNKQTELSDFFHLNINNIMSYNPVFVGTNKSNDGYIARKYELLLPNLELGMFSKLEIVDVSKDNYNMIFESNSNSITPELNQFILFCVKEFGVDINGRGAIDNTDYKLISRNCWMKIWKNGISIDNTEGVISLILHGIKKSEKDLESEAKMQEQEKQEEKKKQKSGTLKFKGVDIEGNIDSLIDNMKSLGLTISNFYPDNYFYLMNGTFIGKECSLSILYTPNERLVCKLIVSFDEKSSWNLLKEEYFQLKDLFKKKYIEYTNIETFDEPYFDGCGKELEAINNELFKYSTYFKFDNGVIVIEVSSYGNVDLVYENEGNFKIYQKEQEESQLDEI